MIAALANTLPIVVLLAVIGMGALVMLAGAVVAVIATPEDRPVEIAARPAGVSAACLGLLIFYASSVTLAAFL